MLNQKLISLIEMSILGEKCLKFYYFQHFRIVSPQLSIPQNVTRINILKGICKESH